MVNRYSATNSIDFADFDSVRLTVASKEDILSWSHGEVLKSETINYRTQKPEKDGLFCERIFGPVKDINPHDSRFKRTRGRHIAVDKKGMIVTKSIVRRERMGHIALATPVAHIWFLRVAPSPLSCITGLTIKNLEKIIYFNSFIILELNKDYKAELLTTLDKTYKTFKQELDKPKQTDVLVESLFSYFKKQAKVAEDLNQDSFDIFSILMKINSYYSEHKELFDNLKTHQLISVQQMESLIDSFFELANSFKNSPLTLKDKKAFEVFQDYLKNKSKKTDLDSKLVKEFEQINKALDKFLTDLNFKVEKLDDLYSKRRSQLQDDIKYKGLLTEIDYRGLPLAYRKLIKINMGAEAITELLKQIDIDDLIKSLEQQAEKTRGQKKIGYLKRLKILAGMKQAGINIEDFCLTALPVIPPNLRPIIQLDGGRFATSDLNDLYRRVINRNNRLKKFQESNAPEVIVRAEKRILQESVDALIDNSQQRGGRVATTGRHQRKFKSLADILKRKQGRLRQNLLGKRVDYSGRSVIVVGSKLDISECGLPKHMALELFKPFVIGYLITNNHVNNIPAAKRLIETEDNIVWDALDQVIRGKYILLNRAPSLHRLSVQAFQPKLIEGKAIQLHPLACKGFNADFDGDTMAVHLPLSKVAQAEAEKFMVVSNNLLHPADGTPILYLDQDIILGLYYLTYTPQPLEGAKIKHWFGSINEAIYAYDGGHIKIQTPIEIYFRDKRYKTTLGRIIFNEVFPEDFPFQNRDMTKDAIKDMMSIVYEMYDNQATVKIANNLKELAFEYATKSGLSIGMDDFMTVEGYEDIQTQAVEKTVGIDKYWRQGQITRRERFNLIVGTWRQVNAQIQELVNEQFKTQNNFLSLVVDSSARGIKLGDIKTMTATVGQMQDANGQPLELSVNSSYTSGLPTLEYFVAARGSRKALIDVALSTADSGYLTRKLVYVAQSSITIEDSDDYHDDGFAIFRSESAEINVDFGNRLVNRYAAEDVRLNDEIVVKRDELITKKAAKQIEDSDLESVKVMSVLSTSCITGIPVKSYGIDLANGNLVDINQPVGIIAAQSIGEPSTQLKLDSKHGGGLSTAVRYLVSTGLNRVEELFEVRSPKGLAHLAPFSGRVKVIEKNYDYEVIISAQEASILGIDVTNCELAVKLKDGVLENGLIAYDENYEAVLAPCTGTIVKIEDNVVHLKPSKVLEARFVISKDFELLVKDNELVERSQQLNSGSLKLEEILNLRGKEEVQRYILIEISKVFASQGTHVADKHLEIIIRQMFSRVQIVDAGDSKFIQGDIVSQLAILDENANLVKAKKKPAVWKQLVLGITKINSLSDSFLVATSFQDITRILVNSAIHGRVDKLEGIIENVILGRRIPVGTGVSYDKIKNISK